MKRFTKQWISVLLCLVMALAMLPVAAFAAATTTVYCQAPDDWTGCYAYWWGSSAENPTWPGLTMTQDEEGIWWFDVPADATGLIFNNGIGTQTTDLTVPTDDKVMFVFANNYWKEYGKVVPVEEYFVAGMAALCGVDWQPGAVENQMSDNGDGTYSMTYTGIAAGSYELKVTMGSRASCWGAADSDGNYMLTVDNDDSTVVISFDPATKLVSHLINPETDITLIGEGTATYATDDDAWNDTVCLSFIPAEEGIVKIDISACDPGFFVEIWADGNWVENCVSDTPKAIELHVSAGVSYEFYLSPGVPTDMDPERVAGSVSYKLTANVPAGEPDTDDEPVTPPDNEHQSITSFYGNYIKPGQTVCFVFDNSENMIANGSYSQMLYINAGVSYTVFYRGMEVPVDETGFVVYEMMDELHQGKYEFSVTNHGAYDAYFTIQVKDPIEYVISEYSLALGDNVVLPDPEFSKTLYDFAPTETGVYSFKISEGFIGNWGTSFNPVDNTGTKDTVLQWTCKAVGQSILIGVTGTEEAILTVEKTADFIPEDELPLVAYQHTYDFSYKLPENPELISIDVLDEKEDVAVLDQNGFYRYGSKYGPLMVADLKKFPVDLADAALNGQLKAYVYDSNGKLISKHDYNDAMNAYLRAGLVPVTEELGRMLKQIGNHHNWWTAGSFVFKETEPADEEAAWMVACSWVKGTELEPGNDQPGNTNPGNNSNNSSGNGNPKTKDISMAWAKFAMVAALSCLVVLKKKENFFLG